MKIKLTFFISTIIFSTPSLSNSSDAVENVASIITAESICGYSVNKTMLEVAVGSLFTNPSDIKPGGRYWPQMQDNFNRIKTLASTEKGRTSYCNTVSTELSAFFD